MYKEEHRVAKQREATRRYREKHADKLKAKAEKIKATGEQKEHWRKKQAAWRKKNPEANLKIARRADAKRYNATRNAAYEKLGNQCTRCGWTDRRALQVDHIVAIGDAERKRLRHFGRQLWIEILADSSPFQLLCANCNWIKRNEEKEVRKVKSV